MTVVRCRNFWEVFKVKYHLCSTDSDGRFWTHLDVALRGHMIILYGTVLLGSVHLFAKYLPKPPYLMTSHRNSLHKLSVWYWDIGYSGIRYGENLQTEWRFVKLNLTKILDIHQLYWHYPSICPFICSALSWMNSWPLWPKITGLG